MLHDCLSRQNVSIYLLAYLFKVLLTGSIMDSMKQFIEKRKKTIQEETVKFRVEYDAVVTYLNSTMKKVFMLLVNIL